MKYLVNLFLIVILFSFISCKDDDNPTNNNEDTTNHIKCSIDGSSWSATGTSYNRFAGTYFNSIQIIGYTPTDSILIVFRFEPTDSIVAGNYDLSKTGQYFGLYNRNGVSDTATSGKVTIDYLNNDFPMKIKGTFNMNITTSDNKNIVINNGSFNSGNIDK